MNMQKYTAQGYYSLLPRHDLFVYSTQYALKQILQSNPWGWLLSWPCVNGGFYRQPWVLYLHTYADQYTAESWTAPREDFYFYLCSSLFLGSASLTHTVLLTLEVCFCSMYSGPPAGSPGFPILVLYSKPLLQLVIWDNPRTQVVIVLSLLFRSHCTSVLC